MDKNISIIRRKPRQLRGTPANRFSIYLSIGTIALGVLSGLGIYYSKIGEFVNEQITSGRFDRTEDELKRMIECQPPGTAADELRAQLLVLKAKNHLKRKEQNDITT